MVGHGQFESGVRLQGLLAHSPNLPLNPGDEVDGRYLVDKIIGTGAVGIVVSARHKKLNERVAIKFLQSAAMKSAENLRRFEREARAAARLKSEHVAHVIDFGVLDGGAPYMVLEYLDGTDLAALLETSGAMPQQLAVDAILQVCEALVHAHGSGVVHRDLKPANLFMSKSPEGTPSIKILDFGISKVSADDEVTLTQANSMIGSPKYMSPEQIVSPTDADQQSDLWSLGVILYELVSGRPPFDAKSMGGLCAEICQGQAAPLNSAMPGGLRDAIGWCLEKDRAKRVPSAVELARVLAPFSSQHGTRTFGQILRVAEQLGMSEKMLDQRSGSRPELPAPLASTANAPDVDPDDPASGARPVSYHPSRQKKTAVATFAAVTIVGLAGALMYHTISKSPNGSSAWASRKLETQILRLRVAVPAQPSPPTPTATVAATSESAPLTLSSDLSSGDNDTKRSAKPSKPTVAKSQTGSRKPAPSRTAAASEATGSAPERPPVNPLEVLSER